MKKKISRIIIIICLLTVSLSFCSNKQEENKNLYESINLSNPNKAVKLFLKSFETGDYLTTLFILDPEARKKILYSIQRLDLSGFINTEYKKDNHKFMEILKENTKEHATENSYLSAYPIFMYEALLKTAKETDNLIIDFNSNMKFEDVKDYENIEQIKIKSSNNDNQLIFKLKKSPVYKKWRIREIIYTKDEEERIWPE